MRRWHGPLRCLLLLLLSTARSASVRRLHTSAARRGSDLSTVHVAYTADASAFPSLLSSLISLSRSQARPEDCHVHLVVPPEDAARAAELGECLRRELGPARAAPTLEVHAFQREAMPFDPAKVTGHPHLTGSKAVFFRLYLHEVLPDKERVLYLDTDTIVKADLGPLYRMPMRHTIACSLERATLEKFLLAPGTNASRLQKHMPDKTLPQLQTGVLLFDLREWRNSMVTRSMEEWPDRLGTYSLQLMFSLEYNFLKEYDTFEQSWNIYGAGLQNDFERWISATPKWTPEQLAGAKILHYSGGKKPWQYVGRSRDPNIAMYQDLYAPYAPRQQCEALRPKAP